MNYEERSDEEINFEVFHKLSDGVWDRELSSKVWSLLAEKYDYCNNPSDAWPIILENKIAMIYEYVNNNEWFAGVTCKEDPEQYEPWSTGSKAFRSAMIAFLMMNEKD